MKQVAVRTVVVFGAGATGMAALKQLRDDPACEVVAFADNAAQRQGQTVEGVPVIAPRAIPARDVDLIVVASHGWQAISAQLRAMGVPDDRIDVHPVDGPSHGAAMARSGRPDASRTSLPSDRIHYACGQRVLDGWLNVDGFDESYPNGCVDLDQSRRIHRADLTVPHPFPDASFAWGYSEDFLEHLTQAESIVFLCEAYRTFKDGGVLRLSFPGLAGILRRHLRSGGFAGATTCVEEAYTRWFHKHFYTFESIQLVASYVGFSDVRRCEYGHSRHPILKQDSRPDQADLNLIVELTK